MSDHVGWMVGLVGLAGVVCGFMVGVAVGDGAVEQHRLKPCRQALLEACKRTGGTALLGVECVKPVPKVSK